MYIRTRALLGCVRKSDCFEYGCTLASLDSSPLNSAPFSAAWNRGYTLASTVFINVLIMNNVYMYELELRHHEGYFTTLCKHYCGLYK